MSALATAELSKQLKDAGYNVPCRNYYHPNYGLTDTWEPDDYNRKNWANGYSSAPTLHEAAEWLRGKGLHIMILPDSTDNDADTLKIIWSAVIYRIHNRLNPQPMIVREGVFTKYFDTHDTALSAGIAAALLIYKEQGNENS